MMRIDAEVQLFLTVILSVGILLCHGKELATEVFNVQPTMTRNLHSVEWGGITCTFSYVSSGGTNEQWLMTLNELAAGEYTCGVMRPEGVSYLFFQEFLLEVTGADLSTAVIFSDSKQKQADSGEYKIDYKKKTVSNGSTFKGSLNSVQAVLVNKKEEL